MDTVFLWVRFATFFCASNPFTDITNFPRAFFLQGKVMVLYVLSHPPFYPKRHGSKSGFGEGVVGVKVLSVDVVLFFQIEI